MLWGSAVRELSRRRRDMLRYTWVGILLTAMAVGASGCYWSSSQSSAGGTKRVKGSGNVVREDRTVSGFNEVEVAGVGHVHIEKGASERLTVEAEDNLLPYIISEVRGGKLTIRTRSNTSLTPTKPINYYVTVKRLDAIAVSGAADVVAPSLEAERFSVTISGTGDLKLSRLDATSVDLRLAGAGGLSIEELAADSLNVVVSGVGSAVIAGGRVHTQDLTLSGTGSIDVGRLASDEATVSVAGVGTATVRARDHLKATVSGTGSVRYFGDPTVDQTVTGIGKVGKATDSERR
jgi:hypothetical protein